MTYEPSLDLRHPGAELDWLLLLITQKLQLSPTQQQTAADRYQAVGRYLQSRAPILRMDLYAQGSMALGTTVKPKGGGEYDLDIVLEIQRFPSESPLDLHQWLVDALRASGTYRDLVEPKKRCVRLNYAGDFYMDVLPARPDPNPAKSRLYRETCILVPDTKLEAWTGSNPRGFVRWFEGQCSEDALRLRAAQQPLPEAEPAHRKAVLQQLVQLVKRHRVMWFGDDNDDAPRSIVLTTLAAHFYHGEPVLFEALRGVAARILAALPPEPPQVRNPTNFDEIFSEQWIAKPATYDAFVRWMRQFHARIANLPRLLGPALDDEMRSLFGEVARDARAALTERVAQARAAQQLRATRSGLTTAAGAGALVRPNTFFGGDHE